MKIAIATPCYGGMIFAKTAGAIAFSVASLSSAGIPTTWLQVEGESLVPRARNRLVRDFLRTDADRIVFVDGDVDFAPQALVMLLSARVDVVGGGYPFKRPGPPRLVYEPVEGDPAPVDGLLEVARIGTGFLSISRRAIEALVAAHPEAAYREGEEPMHALFDTAIVDGRYLSEDWLFCDRWRAIGGRVWMHCGVRLGHIGIKNFGSRE